MSNSQFTLAAVGARVDDFLRRILRLAGLDIQFTMAAGTSPFPEFEAPEIKVDFAGRDLEYLTATKGELLLALEQLTMEMLRMPPEAHSQIWFDVNDMRLLRLEELRMSAQMAAEKVKKSHAPFQFSPMNSRERRILHLALRNETAVRSESNGLGPQRAVVIYPADMKSPPSPPPLPPRHRR